MEKVFKNIRNIDIERHPRYRDVWWVELTDFKDKKIDVLKEIPETDSLMDIEVANKIKEVFTDSARGTVVIKASSPLTCKLKESPFGEEEIKVGGRVYKSKSWILSCE